MLHFLRKTKLNIIPVVMVVVFGLLFVGCDVAVGISIWLVYAFASTLNAPERVDFLSDQRILRGEWLGEVKKNPDDTTGRAVSLSLVAAFENQTAYGFVGDFSLAGESKATLQARSVVQDAILLQPQTLKTIWPWSARGVVEDSTGSPQWQFLLCQLDNNYNYHRWQYTGYLYTPNNTNITCNSENPQALSITLWRKP